MMILAMLLTTTVGAVADYKPLLDLLDPSRPDLAAVRSKAEAGDLPGAVREYRAYLAQRLAKLPRQARFSYWLHTPAVADRLLAGELVTARYGDTSVLYTVPIGKPGQIDFFRELPNYREIARDISTMQWVNKHCEAYWQTKDPKYLHAWVETWRDYLAHWDAQWAAVRANPAVWGRGPQREGRIFGIEWAGGQTLYCGWRLGAERTGLIAMLQAAPLAGHLEQLDLEVLAGLLVRAFTAEVGNGRRILKGAERAVPNQVRGLAEEVLNCGLTFPEFKDAKAWRAEAIPVCYLASQPDGTVREQSLNYFINYFPGLIAKVRGGMSPEDLDTALLAKLETLNQYQDRVLPALARPDGFTPATGTDPVWANYGKTRTLKPPSTAFTSILFPYGGYAVQRDGWQPDSLYLFMKTSRPNTGHWRAIEAGLQLAAYGRNLLVSPVGNLYDARDSERGWRPYWESSIGQNTIVVDGLSAAERKGDFARLDQWRWHTSPRFDFMETEVGGPYQGPDIRLVGRDYEARRKRGELRDPPPVKDVVHRRQVHFLRAAGLWVVTDRVRSQQPHDFTQSWSFGPEYAESEVVTDNARRTIATRQPGAPNLALHQCTTTALNYRRHRGVYDERAVVGWVGILADKDNWGYTPATTVQVNWRGQGEQVLVTLLSPHQGLAPKLTEFAARSADGVVGCDATLADGRRLGYRAAVGPSPLAALGVSAKAVSLLVMREADGRQSGVVLGARSLAGQPAEQPDAEFELPGKIVPITTPTGFRWSGPPERLVPEYRSAAP